MIRGVAFLLLLVNTPGFCDFEEDVSAVREIARQSLAKSGMGPGDDVSSGGDDGFDDEEE